MNNNTHLIAKAKVLREQGKTLGEICEMLNKSKTTVYYWVKDIPYIKKVQTDFQKRGTLAAQKKFRDLRNEAYSSFHNIAGKLLTDSDLRDFTLIYMCEGYRKNRNVVSVANSNPHIIKLVHKVLTQLTKKKKVYSLQMHRDQNETELKIFWGSTLNIDPNLIKIKRKSNSGQLKGRNWASKHGVISISVFDTYLRSKLQALMDYVENNWV